MNTVQTVSVHQPSIDEDLVPGAERCLYIGFEARLQTGDTTGLSDPETDQAEVTGRDTLARFRAHASTLGIRLSSA